MEKVSKILRACFYAVCAVALLIVVVFETDIATPGTLGGKSGAEFSVLMAMELFTVVLIPLSLYFFRWKPVRKNLLESPAQSLLTWGIVRLAMLAFLLVGNTLCYYLYMNASFGYLAIITAICMVFIYPSVGRCVQETTAGEQRDENKQE